WARFSPKLGLNAEAINHVTTFFFLVPKSIVRMSSPWETLVCAAANDCVPPLEEFARSASNDRFCAAAATMAMTEMGAHSGHKLNASRMTAKGRKRRCPEGREAVVRCSDREIMQYWNTGQYLV
ncbi:MAG: hypothetical protein ABJQ22_11205, partial [Hyphomicrobiales bacterium]